MIAILVISYVLAQLSAQQTAAFVCDDFKVQNGDVDRSTPGTAITTCKEGYLLKGYPVVTCVAPNSWNLDWPVCEEDINYCKVRTLERENRVLIKYESPGLGYEFYEERRVKVGAVLELRCDNTSTKVGGYPVISCIGPQQYSLAPLNCEGPCNTFTVEHGAVDYTNITGLIAKVNCNYGYRVIGSEKLTCDKATKTWDSDIPKCEEKDQNFCSIEDLESRNRVTIESTSKRFISRAGEKRVRIGGKVKLECQTGTVKKRGYRSVKCIDPQKFNHNPLQCRGRFDPPEAETSSHLAEKDKTEKADDQTNGKGATGKTEKEGKGKGNPSGKRKENGNDKDKGKRDGKNNKDVIRELQYGTAGR